MSHRILPRIAVAALVLLGAGWAHGQTVSAVTNPNNWTFSSAGQIAVPGMTSASFFNAAGRRFIATFASECAVDAPAGNTSAWTDVDIVVLRPDGSTAATLPPTAGSGDAFCSSNGTQGFDGWETNSVTAVGGTNLPAGTYRVLVRARLNGGATGGWFGERALVVTR
jgi:hypothetical protein